jgi:hypothetical protein
MKKMQLNYFRIIKPKFSVSELQHQNNTLLATYLNDPNYLINDGNWISSLN